MRKSVAKVLTRQHRVDKSFLIYQLIEEILSEEPDANIIYINIVIHNYRRSKSYRHFMVSP